MIADDALWRTVPEFPSYQVSLCGEVRRRLSGGRGGKLRAGRSLKPVIWKDWYPIVSLTHDGRSFKRYVHDIVCRAFYGPGPYDRSEVAHWDGDKTNNLLANLRWVTASENQMDRVRHGTSNRGCHLSGNRVLDESEVRAMRSMRKDGVSIAEIARRFGRKYRTTAGAVTGQKWSWLKD